MYTTYNKMTQAQLIECFEWLMEKGQYTEAQKVLHFIKC